MPSVSVSPILLLALKRIASNSPLPFGQYPNVTGDCHFLRYNGDDDLDSVIKNGAFTLTVSYRDTAKQNGAVFGSTLFNFNAGNSNAIYGKANNVRVSSAQFLMIIKA